MSDPFVGMPTARDRSMRVQCIKCSIPIAVLEIKAMLKIGFYICESCFKKLDKPLPKEKNNNDI